MLTSMKCKDPPTVGSNCIPRAYKNQNLLKWFTQWHVYLLSWRTF